ncbi:zinc-ribbon domain-containing protein [Microbulbifer sp. S227A]|uniref:zinc-ribbon domain-containing protein n=1 Tax=Microbulbifer sp. S227A TaxID=3415131 RepID=UPI003C7E8CEF
MRLTCPNCGAQYEVPDKVIPPQGRDVQCSSCNTSWFFAHPDPLLRSEPDLRASAASFLDDDPADGTDTPPAPPRRKLDPNVSAILQQEAERESRLRDRERAAATSDRTAAPARDDADAPDSVRKARARMARMRGDELRDTGTAQGADEPLSGKLPNADEINSTLRAPEQSVYEDFEYTPSKRGNAGFMRGITLTVLLAALLVLAYVNARTISDAVPQAAPYMKVYVAKVDQGRVWLDALLNQYISGGSEPLE